MRIVSDPRALAAVVMGGLLAAAGCATTGPSPPPAAGLAFPSPLTGPGRPVVGSREARELDRGWRALLEGRPAEARRRSAAAGPGAASTLLGLQATVLEDPAASLAGLRELAASSPGYAAAWLTLSEAAERAGDEGLALEAARKGAALWPSPTWRSRLTRLEDTLIGERLGRGRDALAAGRPDDAMETARRVLSLDPENREARLLEARAALALGDDTAALHALENLGDDPEGLLLLGRIAERRQQWMAALRYYEALPAEHPLRTPSMERAKRAWRISNLPPRVQEALRSPALSRAQLAVLLVSLVPQVEAVATGTPPLLSDIVSLPSRREIVTAVRAGLLDADALEHTFRPEAPAGVETVRRAIERLCGVLGKTPPRWCPGTAGNGSCVELDEPPSGGRVASILDHILEEPGP